MVNGVGKWEVGSGKWWGCEWGLLWGSYSYSAQRYSYFKECGERRVGSGEWEYEYENEGRAGL
jgi:hypothetical protein